jgi:hypothetical protein
MAATYVGNQPDAYDSLFDLYVYPQSSRQVCMHPKIAAFLGLVFSGM